MTVSLGYAVLVLAIYVLAVMRLTKLVNSDTVLDTPRIAVARVFGPDSKVVYFLECPWCVGMWLALVFAYLPVWVIGWPWWAFLPVALACSQVVGMCAALYNDEDVEIEEVTSD